MEFKDLRSDEYEKCDFEGLIRLWEDIHLGGAKRGDTQEIIEDTIKNGGQLFVVKNKSGNIVGSTWITNDKRRNYLHHFGIREEYRGSGLAQKLLEISLEFCKNNGLQIKLEVHKDNLKAIKLYENYKFKYLGDYLIFIIRNYNE
ncbi:MAG: GNAT family N-acetyltransferase [Candidatus Delongbacteria bacterium]|nr:GNAT family N-acetyltransferase [Candidatus Delongbacteria bacterium]